MNPVTVLFFATLKDRAQTNRLALELPEQTTVAALKKILIAQIPDLEPSMGSVLVSVNREFAFDEETIPMNAEIALFPPVSGGSEAFPTVFAITNQPIDLNALLAQITLTTTGAACFFTGMVRGLTTRGASHQTAYLEYEAYQPMAEAKMQQVADEIRARWPVVEGIAIVQRIGRLDAKTPTVLVACTAAHRDTGVFDAARYGIDRLKEIVPVWKKEVGPDGQNWVEGTYSPTAGE